MWKIFERVEKIIVFTYANISKDENSEDVEDTESDTENLEDKPENENSERHFSKDNFKPEKSYNVGCSQEFSDLKNKSVMPEEPIRKTIDSSEKVHKGESHR